MTLFNEFPVNLSPINKTSFESQNLRHNKIILTDKEILQYRKTACGLIALDDTRSLHLHVTI